MSQIMLSAALANWVSTKVLRNSFCRPPSRISSDEK
jgi:hypothetical protein